MKKSVLVIGAGGHARVLIDMLKILKMNIIGATDANPSKVNRSELGIRFLGTDAEIFRFNPNKYLLVNGIGSAKVDSLRQRIFEKFKSLGYDFMTVVHPQCILSPSVALDEGVQIMAGAIIQPHVTIGKNSIINTNASIDHDCKIANHVHVAPGVVMCGQVHVGARSHIGPGAILVNGVKIKANSFIKAGSLVAQQSICELSSFKKVSRI